MLHASAYDLLPAKLPPSLQQKLRIGDRPPTITEVQKRGYVVDPQAIESARQFFRDRGLAAPEHNDVIDLLDMVDPDWRGYPVREKKTVAPVDPNRFEFNPDKLEFVDSQASGWVGVSQACEPLGYGSPPSLYYAISHGRFMPNVELRRGKSRCLNRAVFYLNVPAILNRCGKWQPRVRG